MQIAGDRVSTPLIWSEAGKASGYWHLIPAPLKLPSHEPLIEVADWSCATINVPIRTTLKLGLFAGMPTDKFLELGDTRVPLLETWNETAEIYVNRW
jgi:hypothetical protein